MNSLALFLLINLLIFTTVTSCGDSPCPKPPPKPTPKPAPKPGPDPSGSGSCPVDALKLGVCANLLKGLLGIGIGTQSKDQCCSLIQGLADVDAAVCLCIAIKANVLGIQLNVPLALSLLLNECGCKAPKGFQCK